MQYIKLKISRKVRKFIKKSNVFYESSGLKVDTELQIETRRRLTDEFSSNLFSHFFSLLVGYGL